MNVRLIVPRRADRGHRDRLWRFCRAYWERELPGWEIVEGHHDDGPFNRAAAINRAAVGGWDVAVIVDADVIVDAELVARAATQAPTTGRMTLPFQTRWSLNRQGTEKILSGDEKGSWRPWAAGKQTFNVSTCLAVPRRLWDQIGGFDERFVGWGGEDDAFAAAARALGGTIDRLPGDAWHLFHEQSPWRDHRSPLYRQVRLLAERYVATTDPQAMRWLLAERRAADETVVVVLTNGRRDTLAKTLHSAGQMLRGPVGRCVVVADRCRPDVPAGWDVERVSGGDYTKAVRAAIDTAVASGQPWVFFCEDDFTFNEPVDLTAMQTILDANPHVAQLTLLRQPWYPEEVAAGGVIEAYPDWQDSFAQRAGWIEHRAYWSMNPMLTRRSFLAAHPWPPKPGSERRFSQGLFAGEADTTVGIVGQIGDPPRCTHIGVDRAGSGY